MRRVPARRVTCVLLLTALLGAGCADDDDSGGDTTTTTTAPASSTTTAAPRIVLEPQGLGAVAFGADEAAVVAALTDVFGPPTGTGGGCELAGTTVTTTGWKELTVQFADGEFDAYTIRPRSGEQPALNLKTKEGIGVGSTKAELQAAYGNRLTIPGLPAEFQEPNGFTIASLDSDRTLRGVLSGGADTDTVESLFTQLCD